MSEELKPCYCQTGKPIISKDVISGNMLQWMGDNIGQKQLDAAEYELCVFIDSRGYIQLADKDDHNCIDHGYVKRINYCPLCGRPFHENTRTESTEQPIPRECLKRLTDQQIIHDSDMTEKNRELEQVKKQLDEAEDIILYCSNWIPKHKNSEILKRIKKFLSTIENKNKGAV